MLGIVLMKIDKIDETLRIHKNVYKIKKETLKEINMHTKNTWLLRYISSGQSSQGKGVSPVLPHHR